MGNMYTVSSLINGKGAFGDAPSHLILPALALATIPLAIIARMTRSSLLEVLGQDYIRTARAKGVVDGRVIVSHGLRNAMLPVVTVIGLTLGVLLSGAVLTETIFGLTGIGKTITDSIPGRDYTVIQAVTLVTAILYLVVNLVVDVFVRVPRPADSARMTFTPGDNEVAARTAAAGEAGMQVVRDSSPEVQANAAQAEVVGSTEALTARPGNLWRDTAKSILRQRSAQVGLFLLSILILTAVFAPVIATDDPDDPVAFDETLMQVPASTGPASTFWAVPRTAPNTISGWTAMGATSSAESCTGPASRSAWAC